MKRLLLAFAIACISTTAAAQLLFFGAGTGDMGAVSVSTGSILQTDAASHILLVAGGKILKAN